MEERIKALEAAMMETQKQQRLMAEMIEKQWEAVNQIIEEVTKAKSRILELEVQVYKLTNISNAN